MWAQDARDRLLSKTESYLEAQPFPHIVIDGMFDEVWLDRIADQFPPPYTPNRWKRYENPPHEVGKLEIQGAIPYDIEQTLQGLNCKEFLTDLETVTGISPLLPDPKFYGGAMHMILPGGKLDVHVDFNTNGNLYRRVNLLLYLNRAWKDEWRGGFLELWDDKEARVLIRPTANRLVVFSASESSWHGHPQPLQWNGSVRKSLAVYYYSTRPAVEGVQAHSTTWWNDVHGGKRP